MTPTYKVKLIYSNYTERVLNSTLYLANISIPINYCIDTV
jgi:hypothetical protein